MILKGKRILVGVSGGIAAYKAPNLVRSLVKEGAEVQVILTRNGEKFAAPASLATVSGQPVLISLFSDPYSATTQHITVAEWADALLVAPASANVIAKFAAGIADDYLSTIYLSLKKPVVLAPSMNEDMLNHPATQRNLQTLKERGHGVINPAVGDLACIKSGTGRLPPDEEILFHLRRALTTSDLKGKRIIITCGATLEAIDPVRALTNHSSGKMGFALALDAMERGAEVTLIHGIVSTPPPSWIKSIEVRSGREMEEALHERFPTADLLIMAAAVSDFAPEAPSQNKLHREKGRLTLHFKPTPDILKGLTKLKRKCKIVGFALGSQNLLKEGREKLKEKRCDLLIANPPSSMGGETTEFHVLKKDGSERHFPSMAKREAARIINHFVAAL